MMARIPPLFQVTSHGINISLSLSPAQLEASALCMWLAVLDTHIWDASASECELLIMLCSWWHCYYYFYHPCVMSLNNRKCFWTDCSGMWNQDPRGVVDASSKQGQGLICCWLRHWDFWSGICLGAKGRHSCLIFPWKKYCGFYNYVWGMIR